MSLLDSFPHTCTVESPNETQDATTGGNVSGWASVASSVPCQVTSSGGSTADRFGGDKRQETKTLTLSQNIIGHGYRITFEGKFYRVVGGPGWIKGVGGIPAFGTWTIERITATT